MSGRINAAVLIGSAIVTLGVMAMNFALAIAPDPDGTFGARTFPIIGSVALILLGGLEALRGIRGHVEPTTLSEDPLAVFALLFLSIGYILMVAKLGYLVSTAFAAPVAMWLFGIRNIVGLLIATIVCPAAYHFIFFEILGVFPPFGEWFDLLDILKGA